MVSLVFFGLRKIYITVLPVQRRFWELCLNENAKADMSATSPGGWGDKPDGSLWRVERSGIPTLSPIPYSP